MDWTQTIDVTKETQTFVREKTEQTAIKKYVCKHTEKEVLL